MATTKNKSKSPEEATGTFTVGMPPDLYAQLKSAATREGVGIGLYAACALAQRMGYEEGLEAGVRQAGWLQEENDQLFEVQRSRMDKATKLWQAAHPKRSTVLPDLGALLDWMMGEMKKVKKKKKEHG